MKLYEFPTSGNCYKVRLLLSQLQKEYERVKVDILKGESLSEDFRKKNPAGRVPVLELDDGTFLFESAAILCYLAKGTPFLPDDPILYAQVMQWMFFEQNSHEPNICKVRYWVFVKKQADAFSDQIPLRMKEGQKALDVMEEHLLKNDFFVGNQYTLADICLFPYTENAHEGGFDLSQYKAIPAWLERVRRTPHFIPRV